MTPQPHCEHECVCPNYFGDLVFPCDGVLIPELEKREKCSNDTRSRPAPTAPEHCPFWKNGVCNASWGLIEEEAMKAGAKTERARLLDAIREYRGKGWSNVSWMDRWYLEEEFLNNLRSEQEKEATG